MTYSIVQSAFGVSGTTPIEIFLSSATTAGNTLVVAYTDSNGDTSITGVTIGGSADHFTQAVSNYNGGALSTIWVDQNCVGGQTVVVIGTTFPSSPAIGVWEVHGILPTPVDQTGTGSGSTSGWSTTVPATTQADEVWFAVFSTSGSSAVGGGGAGGWTTNSFTDAFPSLFGSKVVSATGTPNWSGVATTPTAAWSTAVVTLKADGSASVSPGPAGETVAGVRETAQVGAQATTAQVNVQGQRPTPFVGPVSYVQPPQAQVSISAHPVLPAPAMPPAGITITAYPPFPAAGLITLVKNTPFTGSAGTPGVVSVTPANTAGNLLVLYAAWDASTDPSTSVISPSSSVADSAGNLWRQAADTTSSVKGCRCSIWYCPNAMAIPSWLSFGLNGYSGSFEFTVVEFNTGISGYNPSILVHNGVNSAHASTLTTGGITGAASFAFTVGAIASASATITLPSGWTPVTFGTEGSDPSATNAYAAFGSFPAGSTNATWNYSISGMVAAASFMLTQNSVTPSPQTSNDFPSVKVEAAFGSLPGDPSEAITEASWTDISSRVISSPEVANISITRGRQYELSQPESGTMTIAMNNLDGAFNPLNTASPYYPNIKLETPIRVTAFWQGRWYAVGFGYVERWPQTWPDLPQWGFSTLVASDQAAVANIVNLPSAVQGEILADAPYVCLPFNEQFTSSTNTVNGPVLSAISADGFVAANTSLINQRTGTYIDGFVAPVQTGQTIGLQGDQSTGMGTSTYSAYDKSGVHGPGVTYGIDTGLPTVGTSTGFTGEYWLQMPSMTVALGDQPIIQLFQVLTQPRADAALNADGPEPGTYMSSGWYANNFQAGITFTFAWDPARYLLSVPVPYGRPHHVVVTVKNATVSAYIDGTLATTETGATGGEIIALTFGLAGWSWGNITSAPGIGGVTNVNDNYAVSYGTVYPYALPAARVNAHYQSGISGFDGLDNISQRFGRYVAWSSVPLNPAGPSTPDGLLLSTSYSAGSSSVANALNDLALTDGGTWFGSASGNTILLPRTALYNLSPTAVFSDNVTANVVPYLASQGFDYDNTYLTNTFTTTLVNGANTLIKPTAKDSSSVLSYLQRGPTDQQSSATTIQDAYDRTYWSLNKYSQPAMRISTLQVTAAKYPNAFSTILQTDLTTVATVIRHPVGAAQPYSTTVMIQRVAHSIGPGVWDVEYQMSPYDQESAVLKTDSASDSLGNGALPW